MSELAKKLDVTDESTRAGATSNSRNEQTASARTGLCANCGEFELLTPLHLDRGGPLFCIRCGMDWHGKHGRRRNAGRIVIKAIKAYFDAGGHSRDINKLALAAMGSIGIDTRMIQLGYESDDTGATLPDLTSELLKDVLQLVHPDHQPQERRELATRVTKELTSLKPFVFPAPKPEPPPVYKPEARHGSEMSPCETLKKPSQIYPCEDCVDHVPFYYCTACRAEYDKRNRAENEQRKAKQRELYKRRKRRQRRSKPRPVCLGCNQPFEPKRADSKHCKPACRQKAYRQRTSAERMTSAVA